jgi:uncharacterized protein (DUF1501 family)
MNLDPDISTEDARRLLSQSVGADEFGPNGWTRRRFLQAVGAGVVTGATLSTVGADLLGTDVPEAWAGAPIGARDGILINVVMYGGNDGLNTVVPYTNGLYYTQRGSLAIQPNQVLPLDGTYGLHPNLPYLKSLWDAGYVAVIHGVGYPNPDLSHFTSMAIWMSAKYSNGAPTTGWLGRWHDGQPANVADFRSTTIGSSVPLHLLGANRRAVGIPEGGGLFGTLSDDAGTRAAQVRMFNGMRAMATPAGRGQWHDLYTATMRTGLDIAAEVSPVFNPSPTGGDFAQKMTIAARLANANIGFRVIDVGIDGFDTHDGQAGDHNALMTQFDEGLAAFYATLSPTLRSNVTILTSSEFGRTPYSNDSGGTDHGTSSVMFAIGRNVRGGFHGAAPTLAVPNRWSRLGHTVDFRSVYGSILDSWMGGGGSTILEGSFSNLNLFSAGPGDPPPNPKDPPIIVQPTAPAELTSIAPVRVFDTRDGTGGRTGALGAGETWNFSFAGRFGVPANADVVVLNLTAVGATSPTYVTAYPAGQQRPTTSNLNPVPGLVLPNMVTVRLSGGAISLYNNSGSVHLVADLVGYYTPGDDSGLKALVPARLLDTRDGTGGRSTPLGAGQTFDLQVRGRSGVGNSTTAVALNVTVTGPTAPSYITVWPTGSTRPVASSVNMTAGQTVPNMVITRLGTNGRVSLFNYAGSSHVIVDVLGAFEPGGDGQYVAVTPSRMLDTRDGTGAPRARLGQTPLNVGLTGRNGVPEDGVSAVLLNVTAVAPTVSTYVTVYPGGSTRPTASNLNVVAGQVIPNMVLARLGSGGQVNFYNNSGLIDIVADVVGYFTD